MKRSNGGLCQTEAAKGTEGSFPERYLVRDGLPLRSLLPDDQTDGDGVVIALVPGTCVDGVAGAGGALLDAGRTLGGWCSFRCELAVPRRFAAREGKRLAADVRMEDVVRDRIRNVLQTLMDEAGEQKEADSAKLRKALNRRLRDEAGREMLRIGWRLTSCRLENIRITRSEDA